MYSSNITQGPINSGANYTLSGWVYNGTAGGSASIYVNCYESNGTFISTICESTLAAGQGWSFLSATGTIPDNTSYLVVYLSFTGDSSGSNISFSQLKLEQSSIATQWSDESSADIINSDVSSLSSNVSSLSSQQSTNETNIVTLSSNVATLSSDVSTIDTNVSSLSSQQSTNTSNINTILDNYVTQTDMTNGSITPKFSQIAREANMSNQNWLPNSSFLYGLTNWNNIPSDFNVGFDNSFTYGNYYGTDTSTQTVYSNNISQVQLATGVSYTLSGWVFNGTASGAASIYVNCYESNGTLISTICESTLAAGNGWTFLSATGTIPADTSYLVVFLSFVGDSSGSNIGFSQLKLESDTSIPTQWSDESSALLFQNGIFEPTFNFINSTNSNTLNGTSAGSIVYSMPEQGVAKKFVAYANSYENDTSTSQSITFETSFTNTPIITNNTTGLSLSVSTSGLTINTPDSTTTYSGVIIVEGI